MASLIIRSLDESLESRLRIQAAAHGRSVEDEGHDILRLSLNSEPQEPRNVGTAINALSKPCGGLDLQDVPREPMRDPPTFDECSSSAPTASPNRKDQPPGGPHGLDPRRVSFPPSPRVLYGIALVPEGWRLEERTGSPMTDEEKRRDTQHYFGDPIFTYSLRQAIEDGYLVPYLLEERITNVDADGFTGPDGKRYTTANFERDIRMPDRTRAIAEDLWEVLGKYELRDEKTIIFCVDDTHAALMALQLRWLSGDSDYAARITRSERNSHQLERNFAVVGPSKPRVAITVDLLTTGFDAPDVRNIVFVRPLRSAILYKQMKGRGTRLCEDINKRYFTIFDYSGASQLEDAEFDGHPANRQKVASTSKGDRKKKSDDAAPKLVGDGVSVIIAAENRFVCLADGQKVPFEEYTERSREFILDVSHKGMDELLRIWIDKSSRQELREALRDHDIYTSAFRHYLDLPDVDDVDILAKIGFQLPRVPNRADRANRLWDEDQIWLLDRLGEAALPENQRFKTHVWQTALDHYRLFGIDDLEQARTYTAPQFAEQFGSFTTLTQRYGGPALLKTDLELVKRHLYVPMVA